MDVTVTKPTEIVFLDTVGFFLLTGCCQSFDNDGAGGRKETEMVVKLTAASIMAIFNP